MQTDKALDLAGFTQRYMAAWNECDGSRSASPAKLLNPRVLLRAARA